MVNNPLVGCTYYCCRPPIESEEYGDKRPRRPYPVRVILGRGTLQVGYFNEETGEVDDDTNASAYVQSGDLFLSEEEAKAHFKALMMKYVQGLLVIVNECLGEIE